MTKYYDVTLTNHVSKRTTSYIADSFSVSADRILKVYSIEYGNVFLVIKDDEELSINEIELKDEFDYM